MRLHLLLLLSDLIIDLLWQLLLTTLHHEIKLFYQLLLKVDSPTALAFLGRGAVPPLLRIVHYIIFANNLLLWCHIADLHRILSIQRKTLILKYLI